MLLTAREVALALRISQPTVRKLCETGLLPHVKVGQRGLRIPKDALEAYLRNLSHNEVGLAAAANPTPSPQGPTDAPPPR